MHVLLVDDNSLSRRLIASQLISFGCQVTEASNGADGIQRIREQPDIGLLLTDIVMAGGMNGFELADASRQIRSGLRVLFTSGYSESYVRRAVRRDQQFEFIQKPFRKLELLNKISCL